MRAAVYYKYGSPQNMSVVEREIPSPSANDVLIRVKATSINGSDWEFLTGKPAYARINGLRAPRKPVIGSDISGVVERTGSNVSEFKQGEPVFCDNFQRFGGFAEYVCVPASKVIRKPAVLSHEQASAIPQSGVIALQGLSRCGEVEKGQSVLINGAGGGGGSFAVQMAKNAGARVVAIDHKNKLEFLTSIGADEVFDYENLPSPMPEAQFDKILDFIGHHSIYEFRRMLKPGGDYSIVGGRMKDILGALFIGSLLTLFGNKKLGLLGHIQNESDILTVAEMVDTGALNVCIDRVFKLDDIASAFQYIAENRAKGKIVIVP